ncbi:hypothetical protein ACXU4B_16380 [Dyella soli]|uniref:DUF2007 domain-containing protein n=1 Tax=Dyella soli TaxID=522319 RepID=A0A4R0YRM4_9GAMM|nr:hypothetical protein [Dyella soli]TCI08794.1 hypothetical protein EZM97_21295 [Dyella soli]
MEETASHGPSFVFGTSAGGDWSVISKADDQGVGYSQLVRDLSPLEAQVLLGRLQAEGIDAHLAGLNHAQANPLMLNALGGVRLFVRDGQQQLALEVMAAAGDGAYALDEDHLDDERGDVAREHTGKAGSFGHGTSATRLLVLVAMLLLAIGLCVFTLSTVWAPAYDYFPYSMTPEPMPRLAGKWVLSALFVAHPVLWIFFIIRELRK